MKRQFRVSRCENDAVAGEYESNVVVRRVLVLIQVAALRAARQAHACGHFNRCNTEKSSTDRCEVAAEPLGEPSHYPVGASFIFIAYLPDDCVSLPFASVRSRPG